MILLLWQKGNERSLEAALSLSETIALPSSVCMPTATARQEHLAMASAIVMCALEEGEAERVLSIADGSTVDLRGKTLTWVGPLSRALDARLGRLKHRVGGLVTYPQARNPTEFRAIGLKAATGRTDRQESSRGAGRASRESSFPSPESGARGAS